jgi:endonuclease IV
MDLYLHSIYLLNLASENEDLYAASIRHLIWNMQVAAEIGARAVVFHIGSHLGRGFERAALASRRAWRRC